MIDGYMYLHSETKDLIYKRFNPGDDNSPFVQKVWVFNIDPMDRSSAWQIALEALALGAKLSRIKELSEKWGLTFNDSVEMMARVIPTLLMLEGMRIFIKEILNMDEDQYFREGEKVFNENKH